MTSCTTTELAKHLQLTKGRISQYVSEGKLDGCFQGSGRQRRFDLHKSMAALGKRLDPGQMMGNGADTKKIIQTQADPSSVDPSQKVKSVDFDDGPDRYSLARTLKTEEEARRLRRMNAEQEGAYVLASEVRRATQKLIAQEVAEFESVLRDGARQIADELGVDYKKTRQILIDQWRQHRTRRAAVLRETAEDADYSDVETKNDI